MPILNANQSFFPEGGQLAQNWRLALVLILALVPGLVTPARAVGLPGSQDCLPPNPTQPSQEAGGCCPRDLLGSTFMTAPPQVLPGLCQLLRLPTDSRSEADRFHRLVDPTSITRNSSPSAAGTTWPSLWWNQDSVPPQLGGQRLVEGWVTYRLQTSQIQVMDLMVNSQVWQGLTLLERYGVLQSFGNGAQQFGYQLRLLESNGYTAQLLGLYACFASTSSPPVVCDASLDTIRLGQLQQEAFPDYPASPEKP